MLIHRDSYLDRLIQSQSNGLVKIITGLRRVGKSWLLFRLFAERLKENGVPEDHIVKIDLEDRRNAKLRNPDELLAYADAKVGGEGKYYVLIDEVQHAPEFEDVLNSLAKNTNVDVYVTGSNSCFLSTDIATIFRGRGDRIHVWPLSFSEYLGASELSVVDAWKEYFTFGGLPHVLSLPTDREKINYLHNLFSSVYVADIVERYGLKGAEGIGDVLKVCASLVGSLTNPNKLANTFKSRGRSVLSYKTIDHYLEFICEAFLAEKSLRYDVKGKKYINALAKYYFSDVGVRNAILDFRQQEENHIMENVIYNELRMRGFMVDVGIVSHRTTAKGETFSTQYEVDFVANMGSRRYYVQSAFTMPSDEKRKQETESLRRIGDSFRKVIITRDDVKPYFDEDGILTVNLFDFLLHPSSIDG